MIRELLPVVLKFDNVAANSNINFMFTTAGVSWSLGARSGDSLGFSMLSEQTDDSFESCIQKIEFNEQMLAITTANNNRGLSSFALALSLRVTPGVDYLQGYCTLNNEASVMAYFGAQRANEWRNGRISAALRDPAHEYRSVLISVHGARPGNRISLDVTTKKGLGNVYWCLGPPFSESGGIRLMGLNGGVPLNYMSYGTSVLTFETAKTQDNDNEEMEFLMLAYIGWNPETLPYIYLKASCDAHISMYAHVGNRQPQLVSQTYTVFTL
ncbi:hypothetical protein ACO0LD_06680 [Undibacterium sp. Ji83W]|uniref:hypothetical protein n=1 Tax=Undibacterium sp. Ji83W TaxID=3413043 RepID=UPI003BF241BE